MPARIRLRRMGRKKQPHYRIVVADSASPRDGRFVETLGYYKPLSHPARLVVDLDRVDHWLSEGASPSGTVKSLISKARRGGDDIVAVGEEDVEQRKLKRAEALATRRVAEQQVAAEAKAVADAAAAEAKAAEDAAAAEAKAAEEAAAAEAAAAEPEAAEEAPEAEAAEEAPKAEAAEAETPAEEEEKSE
jgi:small subunit ribosomal protein S16